MVTLFKVIVSNGAKTRLQEIYNYYEEHASIEVANKVRRGLLEEADKLQKRPESNPLLPMKSG